MKIRFHNQAKEAERDDGIKVAYAPAKRGFPKLRWYLILLVVSSPLIYFILHTAMNNVLVKAQGVVNLPLIEVRSSHSGVLTDLLVSPGDDVSKGQLLASLGAEKRGPGFVARQPRISLLEKSVELARSQVADQESRLGDMQKLFKAGAATAAEVRAARDRLEKSTYLLYTKLTELESEWVERLNASEAEKHRVENGWSVISPADGRVVEILALKNSFVSSEDVLMVIAEPDEPLVTAYLDPRYSKYAYIGQKAAIRFSDGHRATGHIVELPQVTIKLPDEFASGFGTRPLSVLVRLALDEPLAEDRRIHGLPVTVRFQSGLEDFLADLFNSDKPVPAKAE
ncbi:MAG: hypothetical protein DSZ33_06840 [Gammaproteobacteria bacterium]|nr:MAG: hypothetical protein DSZ33_06840 [Gammaproteobacteria bacterium]